MRRLGLLLVGGCGGAEPPPRPPARVPISPYFAPLFEVGRSWDYRGDRTRGFEDAEPFVARCRVDAAEPDGAGARATILCDAELPAAGTFYADDMGLWRDRGGLLDDRLLPPAPELDRRERDGWIRRVERRGRDWCATTETAGRWEALCFAPDVGIVSGEAASGDGDEVRFELIDR